MNGNTIPLASHSQATGQSPVASPREPEISSQLSTLHAQVDAILGVARDFEDRLADVLSTSGPGNEINAKTEVLDTGLGQSLHAANNGLRTAIELLRNI